MVLKKTSEIIYDERIYPRNDVDRRVVDRYRDAIDRLPPILIDKKNRIIDGYHRLMAHRAENIDEINVEILDTDDDNECIETAIRRNAAHGHQLSPEDKKRWARELYKKGSSEQGISEILSVSESAVQKYTSDIKEHEREERNQKIIDLYLSCHSEPDIAKQVGLAQSQVNSILIGFRKVVKTDNPPSSLQYTNLWEFNQCDPAYGEKYPGRMPGQIVENLLWFHTEPFDVVLDPMAGSGTTMDVCKVMNRRYAVYDLNPNEPKGIHQWNVKDGLPKMKIADKPRLIILDPPYSIQKKGEYTKQDDDLSNQSLPDFYGSIEKLAVSSKSILVEGGIVAFIISSLKSNNRVDDLAFSSAKNFIDNGFVLKERIIIPYENASSMTGYWINDARDNKRLLRAYRDLLILEMK